jgi:hypothetical protein
VLRVFVFGRLDAGKILASKKDELAWVMQHFLGAAQKGRPKFAVDELPEMPTEEPQRTAEAVRRVLHELLRLSRYESRAAAHRDRAIRKITQSDINVPGAI